ncbi:MULTISPECIES: penicillin-insensitive murein endopeptidase [unclassified Paracoccus (in: a-proteobacteria)]|uniref:penicillin-insensitive murein endopeptidase n=1 Tax=unclassified Paracoccus (in: a-proteobacteria) TaxID=2688777 RepID=UPI00135526D3|nr:MULTISPECIES: penicillin-insensitive murein endopeptidase [unclassified Paracoccus (in: a-proteobacteria)]UXU75871.1 penicillin-insensitive murein endopeptidase [Paracoccus sp. SMMA_5]UXU81781.1 penicillin-insensitive murein endopeptidase [Paracoccus sp. SMMA_5_TC]
MIRKFLTVATLALAALGMAQPVAGDPLAKDVFGSAPGPTGGAAAAIGFYSKGCVSGAVALPETGPTWQAMRLSRNRYWGHPELVSFLIGLSGAARQAGWQGLYIGDMSQPRGGPMLSGHASHQMGLDADIWMLPPHSLNLSPAAREKLSSQSVVNKAGTAPSALWSPAHMAIMRAAARDPRVERIFVDPVAKVAMCQAAGGDRAWLRKIRPINNHDYHFHVRLRCPAGSICQPQDPPPPGDGCEEAAEWIRNRIDPSRVKPVPPDPNYRHPRSFRLSEMPRQCQIVATAR